MSQDCGTPELNTGELYRFLGEAVWFPTALMPGPALRWTAIDDARSLATLTHAGISVSVEFHFNAVGETTGIHAGNRPPRDGTSYRMTLWEGHFAKYNGINGMRVPTEGGSWCMEGTWRVAWQGTVTDLRYEFLD